MQKVIIIRTSTGDTGTVGVLTVGTFTCPTLELPWHNNISNFSCIPEGEYPAKVTFSPHMKRYTYELFKVPNRGSIRIHSGNYGGDSRLGYVSHILGCFLLGKKIYENSGPKKNQLMIGTSMPTVAAFENYLNKEDISVIVKWVKGVIN